MKRKLLLRFSLMWTWQKATLRPGRLFERACRSPLKDHSLSIKRRFVTVHKWFGRKFRSADWSRRLRVVCFSDPTIRNQWIASLRLVVIARPFCLCSMATVVIKSRMVMRLEMDVSWQWKIILWNYFERICAMLDHAVQKCLRCHKQSRWVSGGYIRAWATAVFVILINLFFHSSGRLTFHAKRNTRMRCR